MKLGRRAALKAGVGMGAVATLGGPAIVQAQAAVKLPLATVWPDGNFHTVNAKRYADEVKTATSGAVEIDVKSGGQLGFKGPEQLRAVRDGLVPMADILNIQQVGDEPIMGAEGIPFISNNIDELKVLHKYLRPEYEKGALKNNQTILYMVPWPTQYLHLKVKVESLDRLHRTPFLNATRHGAQSHRFEGPGRDMEEGKLAETRLQRIIAHRCIGRHLLFLLQPCQRSLLVAQSVDQLEADGLAAGEDAPVRHLRKLRVVHLSPILHQALKPGIGIEHDGLNRGTRFRAGGLKAVGRGLQW